MTYTEKLQFTKDNYSRMTNQEIADKIGCSVHSIYSYAKKLNLKKPSNWKPTALSRNKQYLIYKYYPKGDLEWLAKQTGQTKHSLCEWARRHGIKREVSDRRNGNISKLIDGSPESFYWLGFLAADGYISKDGHLMVSQSIKDIDHIQLFAEYCETTLYKIDKKVAGAFKNSSTAYRVNIFDKKVGVHIRNNFWKLKDHEQKTYNPISLDFIKTEENALCFLVGFICGDGCCKQTKSIQIEIHQNWFNNLQTIVNKCSFTSSEYSLKYLPGRNRTSSKYSYLYIKVTGTEKLINTIDKYNLPVNKRKWSKCY